MSAVYIILIIVAILVLVLLMLDLHNRSVRLKNSLQMTSVFTNISHELLTPLTVIAASVEHLRAQEPR